MRSSLSTVVVVAINAFDQTLIADWRLPTLAALFSLIPFCSRFAARRTDAPRLFGFPTDANSWRGINVTRILSVRMPQLHNNVHAQVRNTRLFDLRSPILGFCRVSSLGTMWWKKLEYVHVACVVGTILTNGVRTAQRVPRPVPLEVSARTTTSTTPSACKYTTLQNVVRRNLIYVLVPVRERLVPLPPIPRPQPQPRPRPLPPPPLLATHTPVLTFTSLLSMPTRSKRLLPRSPTPPSRPKPPLWPKSRPSSGSMLLPRFLLWKHI